METNTQSRPEESRALPDERICQRVALGMTGKIFECLAIRPSDCPHSVLYGGVYFCVNPNYKRKF
jgi:hypothetical protein